MELTIAGEKRLERVCNQSKVRLTERFRSRLRKVVFSHLSEYRPQTVQLLQLNKTKQRPFSYRALRTKSDETDHTELTNRERQVNADEHADLRKGIEAVENVKRMATREDRLRRVELVSSHFRLLLFILFPQIPPCLLLHLNTPPLRSSCTTRSSSCLRFFWMSRTSLSTRFSTSSGSIS